MFKTLKSNLTAFAAILTLMVAFATPVMAGPGRDLRCRPRLPG